ncbi:hypothetical protein EP7_001942 [Isosphaeraceae bacterium EP7]
MAIRRSSRLDCPRKYLIETAYRTGESSALAVWRTDQAGPYQTVPYAGQSWRPEGEPARLPHEYLRAGTLKALTLLHPGDGRVRFRGVRWCPNAVPRPWLKRELSEVLAGVPDPPEETGSGGRGAWERWQQGLSIRPILLVKPLPLWMLPA